MRHQDPQTHERPEVIKSGPVPPPGDRADPGTTGDDQLDDRNNPENHADHHQDDTLKHPHADGPASGLDDPDRTDDPPVTDRGDLADVNRIDDLDGPDAGTAEPVDPTDRAEFHQPPAQPTAFGAGTVGGAVAASALASGNRADERDARQEDTARPGDGRADELVDGSRTAENSVGVGVPHLASEHVLSAGDPDAATGEAPTAGQATTPDGQLLPGDVPDGPTALFSPDDSQDFRNRWREVQLRFVDDPRAAAGQARELVEDAHTALTAALDRQRHELNGWPGGEAGDTEQLRVVVRRYRDFLDRLLDL